MYVCVCVRARMCVCVYRVLRAHGSFTPFMGPSARRSGEVEQDEASYGRVKAPSLSPSSERGVAPGECALYQSASPCRAAWELVLVRAPGSSLTEVTHRPNPSILHPSTFDQQSNLHGRNTSSHHDSVVAYRRKSCRARSETVL